MSTFGKSIRIYLKDGTVTGIKFGEVVNQTIQSISCPRLRVSELSELAEANRPGVYFLFGEDEETGAAKVYIGEAENVRVRLQEHVYRKEFWNEVIFFVSKDENLTKSHVKYLESRLIQIALEAKRYRAENEKKPQLSSLPLADRDAMEEFLTYIKLLIGVLGHKLLEELSVPARREPAGPVPTNSVKPNQSEESREPLRNLELFLNAGGISARAIQTDEGIVVLKGSQASMNPAASMGYRELRERLLLNETLKPEGDRLVFQNDSLFSSPSAAAIVIVGYSVSGPNLWKGADGSTLKEIENARMQQAEANPSALPAM
ncbi:MAG: GIY-YIG nuclease family protein [Chitinophagaceae bacterium]|nr:MAG: GIY-YIG nuclease family protein [Chitinophagaceae bacterium]